MTDERCDYSDLHPDECDHCLKGGSKVVEDDRPILGAIVVAEYKGTCQVCHEDILPGDHIGEMPEKGKVRDKDSDTGWRSVKMWAHYGCGR